MRLPVSRKQLGDSPEPFRVFYRRVARRSLWTVLWWWSILSYFAKFHSALHIVNITSQFHTIINSPVNIMLKSQSVTCLEFLLDTDRGADLSRHAQAHLMVPSNPQDCQCTDAPGAARTPWSEAMMLRGSSTRAELRIFCAWVKIPRRRLLFIRSINNINNKINNHYCYLFCE